MCVGGGGVRVSVCVRVKWGVCVYVWGDRYCTEAVQYIHVARKETKQYTQGTKVYSETQAGEAPPPLGHVPTPRQKNVL